MKYIRTIAIWDELTERFEEADDISIEDVNNDARKYLTLFLEEGYDPTKIAQMLEKHDVFKFYPILSEHGTVLIDLLVLFDDEKSFIKENFDTFVSYGVSADDIFMTLTIDGYKNADDIRFYAEKGVTPRLILELIEQMKTKLDFERICLGSILSKLVEHGCEKEVITSWLKSSELGKNYDIISEIVEYEPDTWSKILDPKQYVDRWIEYYGKSYINGRYSLDSLPKLVSYEKLMEHYTMSEIVMMSGDGLGSLVYDYEKAGGNPQDLIDRFKKEIGKPKNELEKRAMWAMEDYGYEIVPDDGQA